MMRTRLTRTIGLAVLALLLLGSLAVFFPGASLLLTAPPIHPLEEEWSYTTDSASGTLSSLPQTLDAPPGTPVVLERELPEAFAGPRSIMFRASLQQSHVYLNDELILQGLEETSGPARLPVASHWGLVHLPPESNGKTLTIQLTSPYEGMSGVVNEMYYGSSGGLLLHLVDAHLYELISAFGILLLGIILTAVYMLFYRMQPYELLYIGLFSIAIAFWLFAETRMLQFFTGSQWLLGGLAYMMIPLIPIPIFLYVRDVVFQQKKPVMTVFAYTFFAQFLLVTTLQFTGVMDFFISVQVSLVMLVTGFVWTVSLVVREMVLRNNKEAKLFLLSFSALFLTAILEIIRFFTADPVLMADFIRIGFFLFVLTLTVHSIRQILQRVRRTQELEISHQLAYRDPLTGGPNRLAFDQALDTCFTKEAPPYRRLAYFDLNNLKPINDTFGHREGDKALLQVFEQLQLTFGRYGTCYRIGGDEFACLLPDESETRYEQINAQLDAALKEKSRTLPYALRLASGSAALDPNRDHSPGDWLHRADHAMYAEKQRMKAESSFYTNESGPS
ncbi:sensor domain-containing diguanylate cyclase [Alkalicoccus urumqiensis]|nr:diguanylate cyclase [Alkalicoccus urumqiensis]